MRLGIYNIDVESMVREIKRNDYKRILLQLPEGLKKYATKIVDEIEKACKDCELYISADPCYGACDLAIEEAKEIRAQAIFHLAHRKLIEAKEIKVHYFDVEISVDYTSAFKVLGENIEKFGKKLAIIVNAQHIAMLEEIENFFERKGIEAIPCFPKGRARKMNARNIVTGCNFSCIRDAEQKGVESFLFFGSGVFHALGIALSTEKKVLAYDFIMNELRDMKKIKEKVLKQRYAKILNSMNKNIFGIILGAKRGQKRLKIAKRAEKMIKNRGKKAYILALREFSPEALMHYADIEVFVNTACPRITIDDALRYKKPVISPAELEIVLGYRKFEDYKVDEIG